MDINTILLIGAGKMGGAMLAGWLQTVACVRNKSWCWTPCPVLSLRPSA